MVQLAPTYLLLIVAIASATQCVAKDGEDPTGKVYPGIGDFINNRDEVQRRYAYSAVGEYWNEPPNKPPLVRPFCYMGIEEASQKFNFYAYGYPYQDPHPLSVQTEGWSQLLSYGGNYKIRCGSIDPLKPYRIKPQGVSLTEFKQKSAFYTMYFEPFDDILTLATSFHGTEPRPDWVGNSGESHYKNS